ncbi:MAG: DUF3575 domain-containing protein [Prevotella sp.]|nr:DUF3575 domain-containing protein [Prevotella sp.]
MRRFVMLMTATVIMLFVSVTKTNAQQVAVKTNLLYDATATPNLGVEIGLSPRETFQVFYGLHPWKFGHGDDQKYIKHWVVNPEYRYWFCHRFNGSFVGLHGFGGQFDAANVHLPFGLFPGVRDNRYEGWYVGAGVSYGYQWVLSRHWNFEASVGVGVAYLDYDKYGCGICGRKLDDGHKWYVGPTKAALSLLYMF